MKGAFISRAKTGPLYTQEFYLVLWANCTFKMQSSMRTAVAPAKAFVRGAPVRANVAVQRRGHRMVTQANVRMMFGWQPLAHWG